MKKLLMFLCCVFAINSAWAGCNSPVTLSFQGNQDPDDNEFLYENKTMFDLAVRGHKNTRNTSGDGLGYECDSAFSGSCSTSDKVTMPAGHVFNGRIVNKRVTYECRGPNSLAGVYFDDRWVAIDEGEYCDTRGFGHGGKPCRSLSKTDCSGYEVSDANGTEYQGWCRSGPKFICVATKCDHGLVADANGRCNQPVQPQKKSCNGTPHGQTKTETCPSFILNGSLCKRTCNDGKWSDWALVSCKNPYLPKNGICVKPLIVGDSNGGGNGNNNGDSGNVNIGGDNAVQLPPVVEQPFSCPELTPSDWRTAYASCADVIAAYEALEEYCANEPSENEFRSRRNALASLRNACSDKQRRITESTAKISGLGDKLKDIMSAKLSVWKTAEGNFNGARLASDSIAGVVLGTAGGLITSTVVKKNQVKTGFEDVNCAVGGQNVAGWGDEFTVGIR